LNLGAPIGGGSHTTPVTGGLSSTSHTSSTGHGLTGANSGLTGANSGLTGSHDHHSGSHTGLTGGVLGSNAQNSTSGDRGIGGGHGGPTAFESNPADVGTDRRHDGPGSHSLGNHGTSGTGSHVDREGDLHKSSLGAKASDLKDGSSSTHGHNHGGLAAGGLAAGGLGAGSAALVSGLGDRNHTSPQEGLVGDSITGQQHFAGTGSTGLATGAAHSGSSHHHTGAGAAGLTGAGAGVGGVAATGVSPATLAHKSEHGHSHKEGGMVSELKQELKEHQKSGGYSDSDKHVESEGPHGLVWDSKTNKYVHRVSLLLPITCLVDQRQSD